MSLPSFIGIIFWLVLSDEQMSKGCPFSLLNDEQMSNWLGVEHQPVLINHEIRILMNQPGFNGK